MKRLLVGLLAFLICLSTTGCGDNKDSLSNDKKSGTLTCTKEETDEDGSKTSHTMEVTYNNEKVTKVKETSLMEVDKTVIDFTFNIMSTLEDKLNEVDGFEVKYNKKDNGIESVMSVDFTKLNAEKLKEAFGSSFDENSFYSSKDVKIDDFKEQKLKDYTCE